MVVTQLSFIHVVEDLVKNSVTFFLKTWEQFQLHQCTAYTRFSVLHNRFSRVRPTKEELLKQFAWSTDGSKTITGSGPRILIATVNLTTTTTTTKLTPTEANYRLTEKPLLIKNFVTKKLLKSCFSWLITNYPLGRDVRKRYHMNACGLIRQILTSFTGWDNLYQQE